MARRRRGNGRFAAALIVLGCALIAATAALDAQLRPVVRAVAAYQASAAAAELIEKSVSRVLERDDVRYDSLVELVRGEDGRIEAIRADTVAINRLKSEITLEISDALGDRETASVKIPSGTLTGLTLLSGRGPAVEIRIVPAGYVRTAVENGFEAAGINQTRHSISVRITAELLAVLPGISEPVTAETSCVLAETVMIGEIPEVYFKG